MKTKKRKLILPVVMATLITAMGVGSMSYVAQADTKAPSTVAPYTTTGNKHGFGVGRGQGASGTIITIDGTNITINSKNGKSYVVDASSANFLKAPAIVLGTKPSKPTAITLADVKVGDTIMVKGVITGTNIKATTVTDGVKKMEKKVANVKKGLKHTNRLTKDSKAPETDKLPNNPTTTQ